MWELYSAIFQGRLFHNKLWYYVVVRNKYYIKPFYLKTGPWKWFNTRHWLSRFHFFVTKFVLLSVSGRFSISKNQLCFFFYRSLRMYNYRPEDILHSFFIVKKMKLSLQEKTFLFFFLTLDCVIKLVGRNLGHVLIFFLIYEIAV